MRRFSPHLSEQRARRARPRDNTVRSRRREVNSSESTGAERSRVTAGAGIALGAGVGAGTVSPGGALRSGSGDEDPVEGTVGGGTGSGVPSEAAASCSEVAAFRRPPVAVF